LRTSAGASGNSQDAVLWRLQRKWRRHGAALLAAAKEHRAPRRYVTSVPMRGGLLGSAFDEIAHTLQARRAEVQLVTGRLAALHDDATAALRSLDQFKLAAERERAALGVALRFREQIGRMGDYDREIMRARRTFEELMGIRRA
jgi:hypothetical protein